MKYKFGTSVFYGLLCGCFILFVSGCGHQDKKETIDHQAVVLQDETEETDTVNATAESISYNKNRREMQELIGDNSGSQFSYNGVFPIDLDYGKEGCLLSFEITSKEEGTLTVQIQDEQSRTLYKTMNIISYQGNKVVTLWIQKRESTKVELQITFMATAQKENKLTMSPITQSPTDGDESFIFLRPSFVRQTIGSKSEEENSPVYKEIYEEKLSQLFELVTVPQQPEREEDTCYYLRHVASGYILAPLGNSKESNEAVVLEKEDSCTTGEWRIVASEENHTIQLENAITGMVLDAKTKNGIPVVQSESNQQEEQWWYLVPVNVKKLYGSQVAPAQDTQDEWKANTLLQPSNGELVPAGPISVVWSNSLQSMNGEKAVLPQGNFKYEVWINGKPVTTLQPSEDYLMRYEYYSTKVEEKSIVIKAKWTDGTVWESSPSVFYISKKGIGSGDLINYDDLQVSWYYHWSMDPSFSTDFDLDFAAMQWGENADGSLSARTIDSDVLLSYNEPDLKEQSNISVEKAIDKWSEFKSCGLRLGSPATATMALWSDWFSQFMKGISNEVDFLAIHFYYWDYDAQKYLNLIDQLYQMYHKPIWITEFAIAQWPEREFDSEKIAGFMEDVLKGLDEREYVERYAWFPFDPDGGNGASGLYSMSTGRLTPLGECYQRLGLPESYHSQLGD